MNSNGYQRGIPVKLEKDTSKIFLLIIGILIVALFLFLTFENLDQEDVSSTANIASGLGKVEHQTILTDHYEIESAILFINKI